MTQSFPRVSIWVPSSPSFLSSYSPALCTTRTKYSNRLIAYFSTELSWHSTIIVLFIPFLSISTSYLYLDVCSCSIKQTNYRVSCDRNIPATKGYKTDTSTFEQTYKILGTIEIAIIGEKPFTPPSLDFYTQQRRRLEFYIRFVSFVFSLHFFR